MQSAFVTHTGQRSQNQDNGLIDNQLGLYAVADGVGGGDSGEIASASVCYQLHQRVQRGRSLGDAIHGCHQQLVQDHSGGDRGYAASTIVAIREDGDRLNLSWVGDSRIYLYRDGQLQQMSEDHSLVQQSGDFSPEQAAKMRHVLTQAVGAAGENGLQVDEYDVERCYGDRWLLCSDGLHGVVNEAEISEALQSKGTVGAVAEQLLLKALANGADDNVTLVILQDDHRVPATTSAQPAKPSFTLESEEDVPQRPWHYMVLGGVLALMLFLVLIYGL